MRGSYFPNKQALPASTLVQVPRPAPGLPARDRGDRDPAAKGVGRTCFSRQRPGGTDLGAQGWFAPNQPEPTPSRFRSCTFFWAQDWFAQEVGYSIGASAVPIGGRRARLLQEVGRLPF